MRPGGWETSISSAPGFKASGLSILAINVAPSAKCCLWRIDNSSRYRQFKWSATMLAPSILIDIDDFAAAHFCRWYNISPGMSPVRVLIGLIIVKFVLQISRSPKEDVIQ
jgi:hypothetical protein